MINPTLVVVFDVESVGRRVIRETIGEVAELIIKTFSALTSTPTTAWPAFARQAAVTHPTYPRPNTLTRMAKHLFALVLEFVGDLRPRVPLLDQAAARRQCRSRR